MKDPRTRNSLGFAFVAVVAAVAFSMAQPADRTGTLTAPLSIPMMMGGKQVGSSTAPVGTKVKILQEDGTKVLVATAAGQAWTTGVTVDEPAIVTPVVAQITQPAPTPAATPVPKPRKTAKDMLNSELTVGIVNPERKTGSTHGAAIFAGWLVKTAQKSEKQPFQISFVANHWLTDIDFDPIAAGVKLAGFPKAEEDVLPGQIQDIDPSHQTGIHIYIYIGATQTNFVPIILEKLKRGDVVFIPRRWTNLITSARDKATLELKELLPPLPRASDESWKDSEWKFYRKNNIVVYDEALARETKARSGKILALNPNNTAQLADELDRKDANFKKFLEEMVAMIPALYAERAE